MRLAHILRLRLRSLFSRVQVEQELDEELRYHLERQIEEDVAAGLSREEARHASHRALLGLQQRKEDCRDVRGLNLLENGLHDVQFALRQLRKNVGFTCTSVLMLSLGLAASVAIFAFVDAALIKPLPYRDPARLVGVFESVPMFPLSNLSYPDYLDWKRMNKVFSSFDAYQRTGYVLSTPTGAQPARGARVSDGLFRTLGVAPLLGRDFYPGEDLPSAPRTVILSYAAWQTQYGGKEDVLGQTVRLDEIPHIVIGVMPRAFHFAPAEPAGYWTALHPSGSCDLRRSCHSLYGVARLKNGVSIELALADVKSLAKLLERTYPDSNRNQGAALVPLTEVIAGEVRPILLVLLAGAMLLLLIASVNVTSLLLVRSESRRREIAVRAALGASRRRLISQFASEALVLVAIGTTLGLLLAHWALQLLPSLIPAEMLSSMSYLHDLGLSARVLTFAGVISVLGAVLFATTPTRCLPLSRMRQGLAEGSRGSAGNTWRRLGSKLVVLELATAMVLLVSAGLLGQSLYHLLRVEIGLQPDHLATLEVAAPKSSYETDEQTIELQRQVVRRVANLPGVKSVGISSQLPVSHNGNTTRFRVLGRPHYGEHNEAPQRAVNHNYFQTIGAKLLRGRFFTEAEDASKSRVAIVNQAFVAQYFPGEEALGKHLSELSVPPIPIEIVGIVADIKEGALDTVTPPVLYVSLNQSPSRYFSVLVRTSQAEHSLLATLAARVRGVGPGVVASDGAPMSTVINDSESAYLRRSSAWLVGLFAGLALLLGVIGLYGVIAYSVSQRTREIGVRMALGAQRSSVYKLVLGEAGRLIVIGIAAGLLCSLAAATLLRSLLFQVSSSDFPTLAAVAAVLGTAALLASYLPARRAASVDPMKALRAE